jgi:hypothetical protein
MMVSAPEACGADRRTRHDLIWECVALRHQLAVLKRCRTRRPCFRPIDRLFWVFLSWWWPSWREALTIIQADTVLRWRRDGIAVIWTYRLRGRRWGGRPRIAVETRQLIQEMARANFLWGAPRIHGELLSRVGDWRASLGRCSYSPLARPFVCECHNISTMPRFQPPPRRTQRGNC